MSTTTPPAKNRAIRLQCELVPILRATGSVEGAEQYWRKVNFRQGLGRKLACYGFDKPERQSLINRIAFPGVNFLEVDAALAAGNKLQELYALASGEASLARDEKGRYKVARKGLKIVRICRTAHYRQRS